MQDLRFLVETCTDAMAAEFTYHRIAVLKAGMIFTVEPMINAGRREIRELADGWTIVTKDHSLSAQWEHTVLVTETGHEVLTVSPNMPPIPAAALALAPAGRAPVSNAAA